MAEIEDDLMLVAVSRGDPNYELMPLADGEGVPIDPFVSDGGRLDTRLEVIDIAGGRVRARRDVDEHLRFVHAPDVEDELLFSLRQVSNGDLVIDIWRVHVRQ